MKRVIAVLVVAVMLGASLAVWVRVAPAEPEAWHTIPETVPSRHSANSDLRQIEGSLAALDAIIRATERTKVLAGSVEDGIVTYVTRTALFGFPDFTTVREEDDRLTIFARSRFGKSDLGVNKARVERWLALLAQGG